MAPCNPFAFIAVCIGIILAFFEVTNGYFLMVGGILVQLILDFKYISEENKKD